MKCRVVSLMLVFAGVALLVYGCLYQMPKSTRRAILQHYVQNDRAGYHAARQAIQNDAHPLLMRQTLVCTGILIALGGVGLDAIASSTRQKNKRQPLKGMKSDATIVRVFLSFIGGVMMAGASFVVLVFLFIAVVSIGAEVLPAQNWITQSAQHRLFVVEIALLGLIATIMGIYAYREYVQSQAIVEKETDCLKCTYDLRGNPAALSCPECGHEVSAHQRVALIGKLR